MTPPWELVALAALLLANRVLIVRYADRDAVYWPLQVADVAAAGWVAWAGLPGSDHTPVVRWLVAALMVFHVVQNAALRSRQRHARARPDHDARLRRTRAELRALGPLGEPHPPDAAEDPEPPSRDR